MKRGFTTIVAVGLLLIAFCSPRLVSSQSQLTIDTAGLTCTNGVCDLGSGNVGTFLNLSISASGGSGTPYTWRVVSGKLPFGLKMARSFGAQSTQISGTPTRAETSTFTVQVKDGAGSTAQQAFSLTIDAPQPLVITSGPCCADGTVGTAYHTNFFAEGGVQPYTWSILSGQLPPGLKVDARTPAGISGTPTMAGTFTFTVAVTDKAGTQTTEPGSITIQP